MARRTVLIVWTSLVSAIAIAVGFGLPLPAQLNAQAECADYLKKLKTQVDAQPGRWHMIPRLDVTYKLCVDRMVASAERKKRL